jgi:hypothetical protein
MPQIPIGQLNEISDESALPPTADMALHRDDAKGRNRKNLYWPLVVRAQHQPLIGSLHFRITRPVGRPGPIPIT